MPAASGIFKRVVVKREAAYGAVPTRSGGQLLRRSSSTVDLAKDTYQSDEIRPDQQVADFRHGVRRVTGQIAGDISPGTHAEFYSAVCKRDFAAYSPETGLGLTIAGAGPAYSVTRAAGSWLTGGSNAYRIGRVIRLSVGSLNAANINTNLLIVDIPSAAVLTVIPVNGAAMVAEGPIAGCTVTVIGKVNFIPATGHAEISFAIEHFFSDVPASELFVGNKATKVDLDLPPTGIAKISVDIVGRDLLSAAARGVAMNTQFFTAPADATTTGSLAAVNGVIRAGGNTLVTLTGLKMSVAPQYSGEPVAGSNTIPQQFPGPVMVSGSFTAYFETTDLRDAFINETELELIAVFTASNAANADFISYTVPRIKLGSADKDDGTKAIIQNFSFTALYQTAAGIKSEQTTFQVQDSQA